jgi:Fe-S-cluster containining protein
MEVKPNPFYAKNFNEIALQGEKMLPVIIQMYKDEGADFVMKFLHNAADAGMNVPEAIAERTCNKGCAFCCYDRIDCSEFEFEYIRRQAKARKIKGNKVLSKIQNSKAPELLKWAEKRCKFLGQDDSCMIYEFRPLVCRTHNSTQDPKDCDLSDGYKEHRQQYIIEVEAINVALMMLTAKSLKDIKLIPLHKII